MKLYSMTLHTPKDHRLSSSWVYDKDWNITTPVQLNNLIRRFDRMTSYDKEGRLLATGFPTRDRNKQDRVYVVKWGHDDKLFRQATPLYNELVKELKIVRAVR